jgi:2-oxoglutarate dehydrogenase E1 component
MRAYFPLQHLAESQAPFKVYDSPLSEFAVLGFEFGYAVSRPRMLVLWEAQFGDFANEAQVIIDQYIASSETKWNRQSGLVLLLPHGYEGQGPEHSSGYLERYLQLCAEENMQVCNCTTPAQYFHLLRRQMLSVYRKPLVLMTPKSLLRDKRAVSSLKEFSSASFRPLIHDGNTGAEILLVCSGKIYYDLADRLAELSDSRFSLLRVEQFYPFHGEEFRKIAGGMKGLRTLRWVQEEPRNRGGWGFIREHLEEISGLKPEYTGRAAKASPATGHYSEHIVEQRRIIDEAFKE